MEALKFQTDTYTYVVKINAKLAKREKEFLTLKAELKTLKREEYVSLKTFAL